MAPSAQPTIVFQEDLHPVKSATAGFRSTGGESSYAGGVYNTRIRSRASFDVRSHVTDVEDGDDWQHGLGRTKQVFRGKTLIWYVIANHLGWMLSFNSWYRLAYQSIGVIYGDIGTRQDTHTLLWSCCRLMDN